MGHIKSHYMAGIINMIGLGMPQDKTQVCTQTEKAIRYMCGVSFSQLTLDLVILFVAGMEIFVAWGS